MSTLNPLPRSAEETVSLGVKHIRWSRRRMRVMFANWSLLMVSIRTVPWFNLQEREVLM